MSRYYLIIAVLFLFSCKPKIEDKLKVELVNIINNDSLYNLLTTNYHFKYYKDGVGKDRTRPIKNDTIILLKNNFTTSKILDNINKNRILLLNREQICDLSVNYDKERKVMRPFLEMLYDEKLNKVVFEIKYLVPQYLNNDYKCIELDVNDL